MCRRAADPAPAAAVEGIELPFAPVGGRAVAIAVTCPAFVPACRSPARGHGMRSGWTDRAALRIVRFAGAQADLEAGIDPRQIDGGKTVDPVLVSLLLLPRL